MNRNEANKKKGRILATIIIILALASYATALNPVTGSKPLLCPDGSEPRVYLMDLSVFIHPSHFTQDVECSLYDTLFSSQTGSQDGICQYEYEYGDWYFYLEIYQTQDNKIPDWFQEDEYSNYRIEDEDTIQYDTCGSRFQLVPDSNGNYHVVMHSNAPKGFDSCNLLSIAERPVDLPVTTSLTYTSSLLWNADEIQNSRRLHGAWYQLLQEYRGDIDYLVPKNIPDKPQTDRYPVLMCTATEYVNVVMFAENANWFAIWRELGESFNGNIILYDAQIKLDDSPETVNQVFKVGAETNLEAKYFFGTPTKKVETTEDVFDTAANVFIPRLPSLSLLGSGLANAIEEVNSIGEILNPVQWLKAIFALGWGALLFVLMGIFHYVKTYLLLAVSYLLYMELLYQASIVSDRGGLPAEALAYVAAFFMIIGTFFIMVVDWTGWF